MSKKQTNLIGFVKVGKEMMEQSHNRYEENELIEHWILCRYLEYE